jgi:hypothetical protein
LNASKTSLHRPPYSAMNRQIARLAVLDSSRPVAPGRLQDAIRAALDDPSARLLFRGSSAAGWIDRDGSGVSPGETRSVTVFAYGSARRADPA